MKKNVGISRPKKHRNRYLSSLVRADVLNVCVHETSTLATPLPHNNPTYCKRRKLCVNFNHVVRLEYIAQSFV